MKFSNARVILINYKLSLRESISCHFRATETNTWTFVAARIKERGVRIKLKFRELTSLSKEHEVRYDILILYLLSNLFFDGVIYMLNSVFTLKNVFTFICVTYINFILFWFVVTCNL